MGKELCSNVLPELALNFCRISKKFREECEIIWKTLEKLGKPFKIPEKLGKKTKNSRKVWNFRKNWEKLHQVSIEFSLIISMPTTARLGTN